MSAEPYTLRLPKDPKKLASTISLHMDREYARLRYRRIMWSIAWYYMQGYRRFGLIDFNTGQVQPAVIEKDGFTDYSSSLLLHITNQVSSQLANLDLRPSVYRRGQSLAAIRSRAAAQLIMSSMVRSEEVRAKAPLFTYLLAALGCAGISGYVTEHPTVGLSAELEVIHPQELFPFPSQGQDYTKISGLVRQRNVSLAWLTDKIKPRRLPMDKIRWWKTTPGEIWTDSLTPEGENIFGIQTNTLQEPPVKPMEEGVAQIRELWQYGPAGTVIRYVVTSGEAVLIDEDYTGLEVYPPIGIGVAYQNGTFHGAGLFDLLFSLHSNLEKMIRSLFQNISDLDRFGVLVLPSGELNERTLLRDAGKGLKIINYEPSAYAENMRPFAIQPINTGTLPGQIAEFARSMMTDLNPVQDLLQEKGRVDSASGLTFLDEQIRKRISSPTQATVTAWSDMWRAVGASAASRIMEAGISIPVTDINSDLVGVIIEDDDTVRFTTNPMPSFRHIGFTVANSSSQSEAIRKNEMMAFIQTGIVQDPLRFILLALKEGLDLPFWKEDYVAAYTMIQQQIVRLYGDGNTPGQIVVGPDTSLPELQIRVLRAFMSSFEMSKASAEVREAFSNYLQTLQTFLGTILPEQVPSPEEIQAQMMQAMEAQGGPPGLQGGPPAGLELLPQVG